MSVLEKIAIVLKAIIAHPVMCSTIKKMLVIKKLELKFLKKEKKKEKENKVKRIKK